MIRPLLQCSVLGLALALPFTAVSTASAAGSLSTIGIGEQIFIPSAVLGEDRPILVSLPTDYAFSNARYPVLYVLDGEKSFRHISTLVQFLGDAGKIPQMIVIGIVNTQRERDFAPPAIHPDARRRIEPSQGQVSGAEQFTAFLRDELIPWVDHRYRSVDWRALHGHSLGGLMNFYILTTEPALFNAHLAASSSLWWDQRAYVEKAQQALARTPQKTWLYFSSAAQEREITEGAQAVAQSLAQTQPPLLKWHYAHYPNDDHATSPHRTALDGLEFIFSAWPLGAEAGDRQSRVAKLAQHQQMLQETYGFATPLAAVDVLSYAVHQLRANDLAAAQASTQQWEALYSQHPLASFFYARMALLYAAKGMPQEAMAAYQKSQAMRPQALGLDGGRYASVDKELQQAIQTLSAVALQQP